MIFGNTKEGKILIEDVNRKVKRDARRFKLLKSLHSLKQVSIADMAEQLGVSPPTLKKDIEALSNIIPNIEKGFGEVKWKERSEKLHNSEFLNSLQNQSDRKQIIGNYLAKNIPGGSVLAVGIGTTPYYVINNFSLAKLSDLTMVTSNFAVLNYLEQKTEAKLEIYDLGGRFDPAHMGLTRVRGEFDAQGTLEGTGFPFDSFKGPGLFNYCIITGKSLSLKEASLTCNHVGHEMHLRHAYMRNSENIYIVLDSSKIQKTGEGYISTRIKDYIEPHQDVYVFTDDNLENQSTIKNQLAERKKEGEISSDNFHVVVVDEKGKSEYLFGRET